ncbi:MAG TPA: hypothetical protein VFL90_18400 [Methylomirabilota bacterium]|nr:hypothetical protein [Methylomirabilota bacterium]
MDMNEYCLEMMSRERIEDLRAQAQAAALQPRRPWRMRVGRLLVSLGTRLLAPTAPARATA